MEALIKAIETIYPWPNGNRYRSRLEARYAVFFTRLGLQFEYEKEGYTLTRTGQRYLCDFWLPALRSWVEIKGAPPTDAEETAMYNLVNVVDKSIGHIFHGLPGEHPGVSFCWDLGDSSGGQSAPVESYWFICGSCGAVGIDIQNDNVLFFDSMFYDPLRFCACGGPFEYEHPRLIDACTAARQARFEHGEHGR